MIAALALAALLSQSPSYYSPDEARTIFSQGNDAYAREDYANAVAAYEKLLDHGLDDQDVLYNAGTAALAAGDVGHAVLYLERALQKGGDTQDIEANLSVARSKQLDQVVGAGTERTFLQRLVSATDEHLISIVCLIGLWVGFSLLLLFRFLRPGNRAWAITFGFIALGLGLFAGGLVTAHAYVHENLKEGVVLAKTLPTRELPKPSARVAFEVHAGLKVRVLETEGSFVKVRLPNGLEGWVDREGVADL